MINMTTHTDYVEAIDHLPIGAALVVHDLTWDEYERLLREFTHRHLRFNYDSGRLEVVSPLPEHEFYGRLISGLMRIISEELQVEIEDYGCSTWKRKSLSKGAESDACFYVGGSERINDRLHIDLESDTPPDIVVEIDTTRDSTRKFAIYAALLVPEVWLYDGKTMRFFQLAGNSYSPVAESRYVQELRPVMLESVLDKCKQRGQTAALHEFRRQFRNC